MQLINLYLHSSREKNDIKRTSILHRLKFFLLLYNSNYKYINYLNIEINLKLIVYNIEVIDI
ncbi:hypothetical protein CLVI_07350 [Clostridium vincentii]|uniref:Uncharacterized protein n=1 Tax=Clostridium vincentii TaxID=52704 RepID=A0A2T0BIR6_9CLOT|nr:hypothetical protein CLVI_07350 [Clostridium vincentii]